MAIDRHDQRLLELCKQCSTIVPARCDVTDHERLRQIIAQVLADYDRIDILVNNAGFSYYEHHTESTFEHWRRTSVGQRRGSICAG